VIAIGTNGHLIGIGTTNPITPLGIKHSSATTNTVLSSLLIAGVSTGVPANGMGRSIDFNLSNSTNASLTTTSFASLWTNAVTNNADTLFYVIKNGVITEVMRMSGLTGSVGIGTTAPSAALDVVNSTSGPHYIALTSGANITLFTVTLPSMASTGGHLYYNIRAANATQIQIHSGDAAFNAVNITNTVTSVFTDSTTPVIDNTPVGTLTVALVTTAVGNQVKFNMTATTDLNTPTAMNVTYTVIKSDNNVIVFN
jgi:hypothetical protein